ncbi:hypothetical protein N7454_001614 [Penicillium verhagenii]|nr:hypothetical protein N7454_001614 [Penicillium verhagenii]
MVPGSAPRRPWTRPAVSSTIGFILLSTVVLLQLSGFSSNLPLSWLHQRPSISHEELEHLLLSVPDGHMAREWSIFYSSESHLPGQGLGQAEWTRDKWEEFGIPDTEITSHEVYLNFANGQRLAVLDLNKSQILHEARLEEDPEITEEPARGPEPFAPAYHAYSPSGNVTAPYVFGNFGAVEDFQELIKANVSLTGKIAIIKGAKVSQYAEQKNLSIFRGQQVANAKAVGIVEVVIYPDPQVDAGMVKGNGYLPFPYGPARPETMIERGSLGIAKGNPNDPSSAPNGPQALIPSIPISYIDAISLLTALNGHGLEAANLSSKWHGGGLANAGVKYNVGPTPDNIVLNLYNNITYTTGPVHHVIGAADPGSGSSALNEVVRSFGVALKNGWRPRRTIIFASFEGEEIGVGSSSWIHESWPWLNRTAVAYLNVVVAASGTRFHVKASPLLRKATLHATGRVLSPSQTVEGQTVLDVWGGSITPGGDGATFLTDNCITALDKGFSPEINEPILPYHSQFDTVEWMDRFGDPGYEYHTTTAKIWSLLAANLLEAPVLSESMIDYGTALEDYVSIIKGQLPSNATGFNFTLLDDSVFRLQKAAVRFDNYTASLVDQIKRTRSWWKFWDRIRLFSEICKVNQISIIFERVFYYGPGQDALTHACQACSFQTGSMASDS